MPGKLPQFRPFSALSEALVDWLEARHRQRERTYTAAIEGERDRLLERVAVLERELAASQAARATEARATADAFARQVGSFVHSEPSRPPQDGDPGTSEFDIDAVIEQSYAERDAIRARAAKAMNMSPDQLEELIRREAFTTEDLIGIGAS